MDKKEYAVELKHKGNNCCQAVLLAFSDELDIPQDTLKKLGAAFGVGMGCMEATCGALIGANIILGILSDGKPSLMMKSKIMLQEFKKRSKATICKDLKGIETDIVLCPCDDCVRNATKALEETINGRI